jgi:hypothetical protein
MSERPKWLQKYLAEGSQKLHLNIYKFVEEDMDQRFSEDPKNRFFKDKCFNFAKQYMGRFKAVDRDDIPDVFDCKCGRSNWKAYIFEICHYQYNPKGEITMTMFEPDYVNYFFEGDLEMLKAEYESNLEMFDRMYILECKKCGSWYIWAP